VHRDGAGAMDICRSGRIRAGGGELDRTSEHFEEGAAPPFHRHRHAPLIPKEPPDILCRSRAHHLRARERADCLAERYAAIHVRRLVSTCGHGSAFRRPRRNRRGSRAVPTVTPVCPVEMVGLLRDVMRGSEAAFPRHRLRHRSRRYIVAQFRVITWVPGSRRFPHRSPAAGRHIPLRSSRSIFSFAGRLWGATTAATASPCRPPD